MQIAVNIEDFATAKTKDEIACARSILGLCREHLGKGATLEVLKHLGDKGYRVEARITNESELDAWMDAFNIRRQKANFPAI